MYDHTFLNLQITRSDIRPDIKVGCQNGYILKGNFLFEKSVATTSIHSFPQFLTCFWYPLKVILIQTCHICPSRHTLDLFTCQWVWDATESDHVTFARCTLGITSLALESAAAHVHQRRVIVSVQDTDQTWKWNYILKVTLSLHTLLHHSFIISPVSLSYNSYGHT